MIANGDVRTALNGLEVAVLTTNMDADGYIHITDEIIKNTYRTLMTRGMKGCYVYCTNQRLSAYLKKCLGMQKARMKDDKGND